MPTWLVFTLLVAVAAAHAGEGELLSAAVASLGRGDLAGAEQSVRQALKARPDNPEALDVLGVILDQQKRYSEAAGVYRRAIALAPQSASLLNNYGNHLVATAQPGEARAVFLKVVALNPAQANAAVQLARIALEGKAPAEAVRHLDRLSPAAASRPDAAVLRIRALLALHREREADAIVASLASVAGSDARLSFALGVAFSAAGQHARAETFFSDALQADPSNFDTLYNLGLAAAHAGHNQRARETLEAALARQPQNVDVLYDLAAVNVALNRDEAAAQMLARAAQLAPGRADIQRLLAQTTAGLGYFADAVKQWDRYLQLQPADGAARRERAFAQTATGQNTDAALAGLRAFVASHPRDAVGQYELGTALSAGFPTEARTHLDRALALQPELTAAHIARGLLSYREGDPAAALLEFQFAAQREPGNATILDRLGQTYSALGRYAEAAPVLHKAAELAPRDSKILIHLGRALSETGHADEAAQVFARFRELGPDKTALPHPPGLIDFLSLSPEEQYARYRSGVERTVEKDPHNAEAQVRFLEILLNEGKPDQAGAVARQILTLAPGTALLEETGGALLSAGQYALATTFLQAVAGSSPALRLYLATATFHTAGSGAALEQMDRIPAADRNGDYYLARAEMLDSAGKPEEAAQNINLGLKAKPTRLDLYLAATLVLVRAHRFPQALQLLDQGLATRESADLLLARAILEPDAKRQQQRLQMLESRWPEWYKVWLTHAAVLASAGYLDDARRMLDTATTLGLEGSPAAQAMADKIRSGAAVVPWSLLLPAP